MAGMDTLNIIGGGMAGSEAAWQAANAGVKVVIHEMRPKVATFAHRTGNLGEMVCSNSFRSDDNEQNAVGLLHWEMMAANGLIMQTAHKHRLPAGGALAVDRDPFAESVTAALTAHPNISISYDEITSLPDDGHWIIATGPLTSGSLADAIAAETGVDALAFFDAIAPIVYADTVDMNVAWMQSRYDKGETEAEQTAYLNCPMTKDEYEGFIDALLAAEKTEFKEGETAGYFDGCLPIEVMAERGRETLRFGPMKPVGLTNEHDPQNKPYGPHIRFAGQITGVEGYVESAAMGLLAGRMAVAEMRGETIEPIPATTAMGALVTHITGGAHAKTFQPMNVNFGLFPPLEGMRSGRRGRKERYKGYTDRAKRDWTTWLGDKARDAAE